MAIFCVEWISNIGTMVIEDSNYNYRKYAIIRERFDEYINKWLFIMK